MLGLEFEVTKGWSTGTDERVPGRKQWCLWTPMAPRSHHNQESGGTGGIAFKMHQLALQGLPDIEGSHRQGPAVGG